MPSAAATGGGWFGSWFGGSAGSDAPPTTPPPPPPLKASVVATSAELSPPPRLPLSADAAPPPKPLPLLDSEAAAAGFGNPAALARHAPPSALPSAVQGVAAPPAAELHLPVERAANYSRGAGQGNPKTPGAVTPFTRGQVRSLSDSLSSTAGRTRGAEAAAPPPESSRIGLLTFRRRQEAIREVVTSGGGVQISPDPTAPSRSDGVLGPPFTALPRLSLDGTPLCEPASTRHSAGASPPRPHVAASMRQPRRLWPPASAGRLDGSPPHTGGLDASVAKRLGSPPQPVQQQITAASDLHAATGQGAEQMGA